MNRLLLYTSAYPSADSEPWSAVRERLPEAWHAGVAAENARAFFRWPERPGVLVTAPAEMEGA
jgi:hypothetical protein